MNFQQCDEIIRASSSWSEFANRVDSLPNTTAQGDVFERLVRLHIQTDPLHRAQYDEVWHAKASKGELPSQVRKLLNVPLEDEGIDLIARVANGEYTSIQVKYRSNPSATFGWQELSTFTALSFNICKNISWGVVRTSTTKPVKKTTLIDDRIRFEFPDFLGYG